MEDLRSLRMVFFNLHYVLCFLMNGERERFNGRCGESETNI